MSSASQSIRRAWEEPGAWPIAKGVWRVPLPLPNDGLRTVNIYVLVDGDGLTLIDGGWAIRGSRERLEWSLSLIGRNVTEIRRVLVTHVHRDHYTEALALRRDHGVHVSLGSREKPTLKLLLGVPGEDAEPRARLLRESGAVELGEKWAEQMNGDDRVRSEWGYPDAWIDSDEEFVVDGRPILAIATPGHTQGHYVFVDAENGLLFAGDHVLPTITPSIGYETHPAEQPLGDYLDSLAKVRSLPDMRLLPAHGDPTASAHARIDELLEYHEARLENCIAAFGGCSRTAFDIASALTWTRRETPLAELDTHNSALATLETRAHLELLVRRGRLSVEDTGSVRMYSEADG